MTPAATNTSNTPGRAAAPTAGAGTRLQAVSRDAGNASSKSDSVKARAGAMPSASRGRSAPARKPALPAASSPAPLTTSAAVAPPPPATVGPHRCCSIRWPPAPAAASSAAAAAWSSNAGSPISQAHPQCETVRRQQQLDEERATRRSQAEARRMATDRRLPGLDACHAQAGALSLRRHAKSRPLSPSAADPPPAPARRAFLKEPACRHR